MRARPRYHTRVVSPTPAATAWDAALMVAAGAGFAYALVQAAGHEAYDLRTPLVLLLEAGLATGFALTYAWLRADGRRVACVWCALYGLASAAVFNLVDTHTNEHVLWDTRFASPNVSYVILFAAVHGAAVMLVAWPYARRLLGTEVETATPEQEPAYRLLGATALLFLVVAAMVRALAGFR